MNKIVRIEIEDNEVLFWLADSEEEWVANEFDFYSRTGRFFHSIESMILLNNQEVKE